MQSIINIAKKTVRRILRPPLHHPEIRVSYKVLGTEYGGWPLIQEHTPPGALIYSFGVGEDISFDRAAIEEYGCRVLAFDPTPRSMKWIAALSLPAGFEFHPIGIANHDGEAEFFEPAHSGYVSFSATPNPEAPAAKSIKAKVMRLQSIVAQFDSEAPDILKMDIEGFEYGVIKDILNGPIRPQQLCIEFHHGMYGIPNEQTREAVNQLRDIGGYKLFYVSSGGHEYGFVRDS